MFWPHLGQFSGKKEMHWPHVWPVPRKEGDVLAPCVASSQAGRCTVPLCDQFPGRKETYWLHVWPVTRKEGDVLAKYVASSQEGRRCTGLICGQFSGRKEMYWPHMWPVLSEEAGVQWPGPWGVRVGLSSGGRESCKHIDRIRGEGVMYQI
jgi:hypothetical protein